MGKDKARTVIHHAAICGRRWRPNLSRRVYGSQTFHNPHAPWRVGSTPRHTYGCGRIADKRTYVGESRSTTGLAPGDRKGDIRPSIRSPVDIVAACALGVTPPHFGTHPTATDHVCFAITAEKTTAGPWRQTPAPPLALPTRAKGRSARESCTASRWCGAHRACTPCGGGA